MKVCDYDRLVCDPNWRIVGFFKTAADAEQVAAVPDWQAKQAEAVALTGAGGDQFAVTYPLAGLSLAELHDLLHRQQGGRNGMMDGGNYGECAAVAREHGREMAIRAAIAKATGQPAEESTP
jgi:hypothetical protein